MGSGLVPVGAGVVMGWVGTLVVALASAFVPVGAGVVMGWVGTLAVALASADGRTKLPLRCILAVGEHINAGLSLVSRRLSSSYGNIAVMC